MSESAQATPPVVTFSTSGDDFLRTHNLIVDVVSENIRLRTYISKLEEMLRSYQQLEGESDGSKAPEEGDEAVPAEEG